MKHIGVTVSVVHHAVSQHCLRLTAFSERTLLHKVLLLT